ncbi:hypothetical protein LP416_29225 [Polaromonas sp. P2-4]|nr:hypothetical protein LP416_29225 [Polaromonas sp. P2-4]
MQVKFKSKPGQYLARLAAASETLKSPIASACGETALMPKVSAPSCLMPQVLWLWRRDDDYRQMFEASF